jgi:large subunit ribosomal protein L35
MPKIKTNKTAAKRFKQSSTGKLLHGHSYRNHLMIHKGPGQSRKLAHESVLAPSMKHRIKRMLPNGVNH